MNVRIIFILIISFLAVSTFSQQPSCSDSSIRIKYIFDTSGAILFNNPDTSGKNIFTGGFNGGLALMKTTWGDSILWAKKIFMDGNSLNSYYAPNGNIVCTGNYGGAVGNHPELLISKIDTNGNVQWVKRFRLSLNHNFYAQGYWGTKNILLAYNSIYFDAQIYFTGALPNQYTNIIAKLDIDGNIIWSKNFTVNLPRDADPIYAPVIYNNKIVFASRAKNQQSTGPGSENYFVLTQLNENDGNFIASNSFKTISDTLIKGMGGVLINHNYDNSFSFTGNINIELVLGTGLYGPSGILFNSQLDSNLNPIHNFYYKNRISLSPFNTYVDFNNQKQHAFLSEKSGYNFDKYFFTFGNNDEILRSRKFVIPSNLSSLNTASVNLDNKQNLHFIYHYFQSGRLITEYARISNFAPTGTLSCFGKDTSILTQYPFTITKESFSWDNITSDVLTSNDVPYIQDTAIVTKVLVCKIVSLCDSVHIKGPISACIGQPLRYTVSKNSGCFKNLDWQIDTAVANIVNAEGDSAITLSFKKAFAGYIHAAISDCVVKDSFFVTVIPSPKVYIINRDSVLCPGKANTLNSTAGFTNYKWQDGSTLPYINIRNPGFYKITATSYCGIPSADSITVKYTDTVLNLLPPVQTICLYDTAFIVLPVDVNNITWQPIGNALLNNNTIAAYPTQNTAYVIRAERFPNCTVTNNTAIVVKRCPEFVFVPGAFTPNNDGLNDIFRATVTRPVAYYQFIVYNRYGQKLFESSNPAAGWDGSYRGSRQNIGGYTWQVTYQFRNGVMNTERGTCLLLR